MKKLKTVSVIGHFSFKKELLNGQTIKTKNISDALEKALGSTEVHKYDTHGGIKALLKLPFQVISSLHNTKNIVVLPANRGLRFITPFLLFFNRFYKRKIHYVVIGGWLPDLCLKKKRLAKKIKRFHHIYVETFSMMSNLEKQGFLNVTLMPNFKNIIPIDGGNISPRNHVPLKLCTFSRVMKEKGIEDAVNAVLIINKENAGKCSLDIYGEVDSSQTEWFKNLKRKFSTAILYKGCVSYYKSVEILKDYDALLFPTYYEGEGFAGTLLDAMAAGLPIVASDWKYNKEIVNTNNGALFQTHDLKGLINAILLLNVSRRSCLLEYQKYSPSVVIKKMIENF